jgi:hypothetical protein
VTADTLGLVRGSYAHALAIWHCNQRRGFHARNEEKNGDIYRQAVAADIDGTLELSARDEGHRMAEVSIMMDERRHRHWVLDLTSLLPLSNDDEASAGSTDRPAKRGKHSGRARGGRGGRST